MRQAAGMVLNRTEYIGPSSLVGAPIQAKSTERTHLPRGAAEPATFSGKHILEFFFCSLGAAKTPMLCCPLPSNPRGRGCMGYCHQRPGLHD